jgi:glyoxylase-like metal-dependent hydrolase (beta-lactamase superfamily II)
MHLGDLEINYIDGGTFALDGGAMFGVVPKVLWEKKSSPDENNRICMKANALLVRTAGKIVLIETGNGTKWDAKLRSIYNIQAGDSLIHSLANAGVSPNQVEFVINTHLHFDHCGGNTRMDGNRAVPTFPNARYIVQRAEFEHAMNPTDRDRASYFPENVQPIADAGQWDLVEGDREILPGISIALIPGHNASIQAVVLQGAGKTLAFVADLFPTRHHIPLPWIMAYDLYPLQSLETKRKWLSRIVNENWIVVFGHDPDIPAATLHEREGKIEITPVDLNR